MEYINVDFGISPDIEAYWCYLLVALVGATTALRQMQPLRKFPGVWLVWHSWLLLSAYLLIPLLLFWFLDRSGAINDTSLFAAVIVGVGYDRILAGSSPLKAGETISWLWSPFLAYAERVPLIIGDQDRKRSKRFANKIVSDISASPERVEALDKAVRSNTADLDYLEETLAELEKNKSRYGLEWFQEQKVRALYEDIQEDDEIDYILVSKGIVGRWFLFVRSPRSRSRILAVFIALLMFAAVGSGVRYIFDPKFEQAYYLWRIQKTGATVDDKDRTRERLPALIISGLESKDHADTQVAEGLSSLLRGSATSARRADEILQLFLIAAGNQVVENSTMAQLLLPSLRTPNIDVRSRVHDTLVFLAESDKRDLPAQLQSWQPAKGDSLTQVERYIRAWMFVWLGK